MSKFSELIRNEELHRETVENVPLVGRMTIRRLWAEELLTLAEKQNAEDEDGKKVSTLDKMRLSIVATCEDPDSGEPAFTEADMPHMRNWGMLSALNGHINRICGLNISTEQAEKN